MAFPTPNEITDKAYSYRNECAKKGMMISLEDFALSLNVSKRKLERLCEGDEPAEEALNMLRTSEVLRLKQAALAGDVNPAIAKLIIETIGDYATKLEFKNTNELNLDFFDPNLRLAVKQFECQLISSLYGHNRQIEAPKESLPALGEGTAPDAGG